MADRATYDVLALGNAVVDVLATTTDAFLAQEGIDKGGMTLIDAATAERLYAHMGPTVESSGGSAANTVAGFGALGGRAAFIGRVGDDQFGRVFAHDITALGIDFHGRRTADGAPTACCYILVTPDAERTMQTFLGASTELGPENLDHTRIAQARTLYLEGYLWDKPAAKEAVDAAAATARQAGREVALSLSDPFCVKRHGDSLAQLVRERVDLLFANAEEICLLFGVDDVAAGLARAAETVETVVVTDGPQGCRVVSGHEHAHVPAVPPAQLVDTTGAGDQFAAGFLDGRRRGLTAADCARVGAIAAAEVIDHMGPRPQRDVARLAAEAGLF